MYGAAKIILIDPGGKYLLLYRDNHPTLGNDPDLPGGTVEKGESHKDAVIREVFEEIGLKITDPIEIYSGSEYSRFGMIKSLYLKHFNERPEINLSWEHSRYEWVSREELLEESKYAKDRYMHMVYDILSKNPRIDKA